MYTPVLVLTVLGVARLLLAIRPRVQIAWPKLQPFLLRASAAFGLACVLPLSPVLYALSYRVADGGTLHEPIYWRSSPNGVDLLALVVPSPHHPILGGIARDWLTRQPEGLVENVASIPWTAIIIIALAMWRYGARPRRLWIFITAAFGALALGPFVHIAGLNTYVPGPWALMRYLPVIGSARTPARFSIVMMMGISILFAVALRHLTARMPQRRRTILALVAVALVLELAPFPRPLYSAALPAIYRTIAADPRDMRVMTLPIGIRDGTQSVGDFSPSTQFYQAFHEKRLIGGYLSRVPRTEIRRQKRFHMLRALMRLSDGLPVPQYRLAVLQARGRQFVQRARIGYVVIDRTRASAALIDFAIDAFELVKIGESDGHELYRPAHASF